MRVARLPDLDCFRTFPTIGPNGRHHANINGRAAAIEVYLDLPEDACVRWSSYNDKAGELIDKEQYTRQFLNQRNKEAGYHYDNIATVLNLVVKNAIAMREALTMADYIHKYEDRLMSMQASTFAKIGSGAYRAGARSRAVLHENLPRLSQYRRCICQSGRCIRTNLSPPMGPVQRQSFHRCADALR